MSEKRQSRVTDQEVKAYGRYRFLIHAGSSQSNKAWAAYQTQIKGTAAVLSEIARDVFERPRKVTLDTLRLVSEIAGLATTGDCLKSGQILLDSMVPGWTDEARTLFEGEIATCYHTRTPGDGRTDSMWILRSLASAGVPIKQKDAYLMGLLVNREIQRATQAPLRKPSDIWTRNPYLIALVKEGKAQAPDPTQGETAYRHQHLSLVDTLATMGTHMIAGQSYVAAALERVVAKHPDGTVRNYAANALAQVNCG